MVVDKYGITYLNAYYCTYDPGEGCREGYNVLMKFNSSGQLMWESRYEGDKKSSALTDNDEEAIYVAYGVGIALSSALQQEEDDDDNTPYPDTDDDDDDSGCGCQ